MAHERGLNGAAPTRVLCVDDDRIHALLLGELCRGAGAIELAIAETAQEALALAAGFAPQLLLLDMHLPDGDGLTLLPLLRARAGRPALPAVLCTAELPCDVAPQARAAGFDDVWAKPIALQTLCDAVARAASQGGADTA